MNLSRTILCLRDSYQNRIYKNLKVFFDCLKNEESNVFQSNFERRRKVFRYYILTFFFLLKPILLQGNNNRKEDNRIDVFSDNIINGDSPENMFNVFLDIFIRQTTDYKYATDKIILNEEQLFRTENTDKHIYEDICYESIRGLTESEKTRFINVLHDCLIYWKADFLEIGKSIFFGIFYNIFPTDIELISEFDFILNKVKHVKISENDQFFLDIKFFLTLELIMYSKHNTNKEILTHILSNTMLSINASIFHVYSISLIRCILLLIEKPFECFRLQGQITPEGFSFLRKIVFLLAIYTKYKFPSINMVTSL
ncbi:hypothetical protein EDEG_01252 [Edhazardia aedis USNM 41457]|uniref:Uncharacterized protein n=1 Tax=Edhazardia aedis (strain USNM 41457) TaxID=1003232 RepID=J9DPR1_EDHAE|nr:hypothetical protein EDEG_01252 [Edhazardia aedis USNM 41457]|eukprot:EJW04540.1 hypothetical protein EDEG_01252 [Edhazardia aedis USNM 41457]